MKHRPTTPFADGKSDGVSVFKQGLADDLFEGAALVLFWPK